MSTALSYRDSIRFLDGIVDSLEMLVSLDRALDDPKAGISDLRSRVQETLADAGSFRDVEDSEEPEDGVELEPDNAVAVFKEAFRLYKEAVFALAKRYLDDAVIEALDERVEALSSAAVDSLPPAFSHAVRQAEQAARRTK